MLTRLYIRYRRRRRRRRTTGTNGAYKPTFPSKLRILPPLKKGWRFVSLGWQ